MLRGVKTMRYFISILLLLVFICQPGATVLASEKSGEKESPRAGETWKWIGIPFVYANSDFGIIYGVGVGAAQGSDRYLSTSMTYSARGNIGAGIVGEFRFGNWRLMRSINFYQKKRYIFHEIGAATDTLARATMNEGEALLSALYSFSKNFEWGPDLQVSFSEGRSPKGKNQETLPADSLERFRQGSLALLGVRARWKTTSSIRPMNGLLCETAVRTGRAGGERYAAPRVDLAAEVKLAGAKSLLPHTRIYCRGWGQYQLQAPTPVRNDLGGELTLRGEPEQRDFGRQLLLGRSQLHWLVLSGITFPARWLNRMFSFFPVWAIDVESVFFYDCGAAGDPDYPSWRRTRHGFGTGLRIILPPELVFHVDFAWTPYGGKAFYFGAGETL